MKRLLLAVLAFGTMLLGPAIPAQAALPTGCTVNAGKILASTSTANRAVDIRYPGITCTAVHYVIATHTSLYSLTGTTWVTVASVAYSQAVFSVSSMSGASFHVSCPHKTRVQARISYGVRDSSTGMWWSVRYLTPTTICS